MKKKIALLILTFCALLSALSCSKNETDYEAFFESVFELTCTAESRFENKGTAFKLATGEIITNSHLVTYKEYGEYVEYEQITISFYKSSDSVRLKIVAIDNEKDIAIMEPADKSDTFAGIKGLKASNPKNMKIGDSLYTIGNLNNYGLCLNTGILSAKEKQIENNGAANTYFQSDIEISKGSSGGPVLNRQGEVVGVMTFKLRDTNYEYVDGASFFVPIDTVSGLLKK